MRCFLVASIGPTGIEMPVAIGRGATVARASIGPTGIEIGNQVMQG